MEYSELHIRIFRARHEVVERAVCIPFLVFVAVILYFVHHGELIRLSKTIFSVKVIPGFFGFVLFVNMNRFANQLMAMCSNYLVKHNY